VSFPRYTEYKGSGVEWLGDVPSHWRVLALARASVSRCDGPFGSGLKSEHYTDGGTRVVRLQNIRASEFDGRDAVFIDAEYGASELAGHDVLSGDVLIAGLGDENNVVGRACMAPPNLGSTIVKADCFRFRLDRSVAHPEFVAFQLSAGAPHAAGQLATGTTRSRIPLSLMASRRLALPPTLEQKTIARFIIRETAKIDALVAEQKKLIALLKEKRQALISHAVTKGLDPAVPMKDSGIEWLGQVPAHWEVVSLARVTRTKCDGPFGSGLKSEHYVDEGVRVIRLQNIRSGAFDDRDAAYIDPQYCAEELEGHDVRGGDVLIAGLGDDNNTVGRACVAPVDIEPAMVKADCFRFRVNERAHAGYVSWALTAGATFDAGRLATGTTRSRIPLSVTATRKLPLPPRQEQADIFEFIRRRQSELSSLVSEAERAIDLFKERRSALISAAVTGKIDVRNHVSAAPIESAP